MSHRQSPSTIGSVPVLDRMRTTWCAIVNRKRGASVKHNDFENYSRSSAVEVVRQHVGGREGRRLKNDIVKEASMSGDVKVPDAVDSLTQSSPTHTPSGLACQSELFVGLNILMVRGADTMPGSSSF